MEKKQLQNNWVVKCPHCGKEYHLCEIAMPGELLGTPRPNGIIKDPLGKILYLDFEDEPATTFEFTCEDCDKDFLVDVLLQATVRRKPEEEDFSNLETSLL